MPTEQITRFAGPYRFLSNFYPSPFNVEGIDYGTNEHFFNAHKTLDPVEHAWVAGAPTPAEAKSRGRRVVLRPDWDTKVRYDVMRRGLELKFSTSPLLQLRVDTAPAELVEGTDWHDTHWGVCVCGKHRGAGENHLGRMLMELRAELIQ